MTSNESFAERVKHLLTSRILYLGAVIVALLAFLYFSRSISIILTILIQVTIFSIITMSLNLETGYTGIPQFGRVAAVIAGAFAVGAIPGRIMAGFMGLPAGVEYASDTVNFKVVPQINNLLASNWLMSLGFLIMCIVIAGAAGAIIGWLISRPAIRLKEAYLGISMLAIGDFFMWVGHNWTMLVGGSVPVNVPDPFRMFGPDRFNVIVPVFFLGSVLL